MPAPLRTGEHKIEFPGIRFHRHTGETGHRVHQHGAVVAMCELRERFEVGEHTGAGFRVHHGERGVATTLECAFHGIERHGAAPVTTDHGSFAAARLRDVGEALTERAVHETQDGPGPSAANGGFHEPRRASKAGYVHRPRGAEDGFESRLDACEQRFEHGAAVWQHGLQHRAQHIGMHFRGAGQEKRAEVAHRSVRKTVWIRS